MQQTKATSDLATDVKEKSRKPFQTHSRCPLWHKGANAGHPLTACPELLCDWESPFFWQGHSHDLDCGCPLLLSLQSRKKEPGKRSEDKRIRLPY